MVSLWLSFATAVLFILDNSVKAEEKTVIYKNAKNSRPSYNEVPFDPSKPLDIFQDLLGLKSLQTLNYNLPTLQLPLVQQLPQNSYNDGKAKPTSPPPPPLPPPPPVPKQQTTPATHHNYPTIVPYRRPAVFYHVNNNYQDAPPRSLSSSVEYKQVPTVPTNYEKPVAHYVIVSRNPLPSLGDTRELPPPPPSELPHPIPPPKHAPAITYSGSPRVAEHNKYELNEGKTVQAESPVQVSKSHLAQIITDAGPRYYLPQPTTGNEGYYGAFKNSPGSFDALLKSDLSFLHHLNNNPNTTEQGFHANIKEETHEKTKEVPSSGNDQSYKPESENQNYYPPSPDSPRPLSAPARQSYSSSYPSSQSTEEKSQSYHKPVPSQKDKKDDSVGLKLDDIPYGYISSTKASESGKEDPDYRGIISIQNQPQGQPVQSYILERPAVVEYRPLPGHHNEQDESGYRPQIHQNEASDNDKSQEQSSANYRPEKHPNKLSSNYRPENHLREINYNYEGHHNQPETNYRKKDYSNQQPLTYRPDSHSYQQAANYRTEDHPNHPAANYKVEGRHNQPVTNYRAEGYPTRSAAHFRSEGHPTTSAVNYGPAVYPARSSVSYRPESLPTRSYINYDSEEDSRQTPTRYQASNEETKNYRGKDNDRLIQPNYRKESRPDTSQESSYAQENDRYRSANHPDAREYHGYRQGPTRGRNGLQYSPDKSEEDRSKDNESEERPSRTYNSDERDEERHSYRDEERPPHREAPRYPQGEATRHRYRNEEYDDDDEPFDNDNENIGRRRLKRQVATVAEKYQRSPKDPAVLKVFRAITVNGTDGILVDERYVRDKDGKAVNVYTHSQTLTDSFTSTVPTIHTTGYIPTAVPQQNEGFATLTDIATEPTIISEQEVKIPQRENLEELDVPECAKNHSIPICTTDNEYPMEEISRALIQYNKFVSKLSGLSITPSKVDDAASNGSLRPLSEKSWTNICPSYISHIRPLRARNLKGEWKIIVNVNEIRQNLNIETCLTLGERCSLVPLTFQTQCDQKYAVLHLLTYDAKDGLAVDQFLVPAACSCSVAKV